MTTPIVQFGTSRFLQAHVDLFVGEALERRAARGGITVVQTTVSRDSRRRIEGFRAAATATPTGYPVRIRGLCAGEPVDRLQRVASVQRALSAAEDWDELESLVADEAQLLVSNTGDRGYQVEAGDLAALTGGGIPAGFPAKLCRLLYARYVAGAAALTIYPCELVSRNGEALRDTVLDLARQWRRHDEAYFDYLARGCIWVNSLVDRIVSEALDPVGAVAEPYALWAIESQPGMVLPCRHSAIVVTDDLASFERLKLFVLNLGHTLLADLWLRQQGSTTLTVREAMGIAALRDPLECAWQREVLPVFEALGQGERAAEYCAQVRERLLNPYLDHRLADIAQNHAQKKARRLQPLLQLAGQLVPDLHQPLLRAAAASP